MTECMTSEGKCEVESSCEIKVNCNLINRAVYTALESVTLADLVAPVRQQAVNIVMPITKEMNELKVES